MGIFDEHYGPQISQAGQALDKYAQQAILKNDVLSRLQYQQHELKTRLSKIENLLGLLKDNPQLIQIIDLSRDLL